jgi:hypothetical protein
MNMSELFSKIRTIGGESPKPDSKAKGAGQV